MPRDVCAVRVAPNGRAVPVQWGPLLSERQPTLGCAPNTSLQH
jgi:hypothetical protein